MLIEYEHDSYKVEIVGANPTFPTNYFIMKEEISEYYKQKGYIKLYVGINKDPRRVATLKKDTGETLTMSYAKYLYTSFYKEDIPRDMHIDHINGDKLDDRIENLQKVTGIYNRQKDHPRKEMVICICPVCGKEFLFEKRNLPFHKNPCCSRRCGGIKSHWK